MKKNFMDNTIIIFTEQSDYTCKQNVSNDILTNDLEYSSTTNENLEVKNIFKNHTPFTLEPSQPSRIHTIMDNTTTSSSNINEIKSGLDFILSHFEELFLFPRKISTYKSNNKQFLVRSRDEIINSFIDSNFVDCRINAYPCLTDYKDVPRYKPDCLFIDLDRNNPNFKTDRSFKIALSTTLRNIKEKLGNNDAYPTVLFTGGGYHIYQPVYCLTALENITEFQKFENPSQEFLRFAKDNLSNGKADKNNNPSFKSCLLRIPGSINSTYNTQVKIIQKWNKVRPSIPREFIEEFRTYLIQKKIDEYNYRQKIKARSTHNNNIIFWIEKLLKTLIADYRKIIVNLILAPYLVVIKKLSYDESYQIINEWLQKCSLLRKLDFNSKSVVNIALTTAQKKQIPPMSITTMKTNYNDLYFLIEHKKEK